MLHVWCRLRCLAGDSSFRKCVARSSPLCGVEVLHNARTMHAKKRKRNSPQKQKSGSRFAWRTQVTGVFNGVVANPTPTQTPCVPSGRGISFERVLGGGGEGVLNCCLPSSFDYRPHIPFGTKYRAYLFEAPPPFGSYSCSYNGVLTTSLTCFPLVLFLVWPPSPNMAIVF